MKRVEIFLCVDKATKNPDKVEGLVPFPVNDDILFFGPDQTALRADLRKRFFTYTHDVVPEVDLYLVGVNDVSKDTDTRKIIWVGKITRIMTFNIANSLLEDPVFEPLIDVRTKKDPGRNMSPLHVEPIGMVGNLAGYHRRSDFHSKVSKDGIPDWVKDIIDPRDKGEFSITEKELFLGDLSLRKKAFRRDCCFLCENVFFAKGSGMEIRDKLVSLLDEWQPGQGVDSVGIFGYSQGKDGKRTMNKLKGPALHIRWRIAEGILDYILKNRP